MSDKERRYRINIESPNLKIEVEGDDKEWVERNTIDRMNDIAGMTIQALPTDQVNGTKHIESNTYDQLPLFAGTDTSETVQSHDVPVPEEQNGVSKTNGVSQTVTLKQFYQNLAVKYQHDNILAIVYWRQNLNNEENVTKEDIESSYRELQYFGIDVPKDNSALNDRIHNTIKKGYIFRREHATYAVTREGEERIKEMMQNAESV